MADFIIKPVAAAGNKLILQDQAGGAVITTADSGATMASTVTGIPAAGVTGVLPSAVTGGSGLTALSASNLSAGTVPDARFPATLPAASGTNLTALPAANLTGTFPTSGTIFPQYHTMASGFSIQYYTGYFNGVSALTFDFATFDSGSAGNLYYFKAMCSHYALSSYASYRSGYGYERSGTMNAAYETEHLNAMGTFTISMTSPTNVRVTKSAGGGYLGHGFVMIMGRNSNV